MFLLSISTESLVSVISPGINTQGSFSEIITLIYRDYTDITIYILVCFSQLQSHLKLKTNKLILRIYNLSMACL